MVNNDTSFPPHRIHSTSRVSPTEALSLITAYLEKAETDTSLHPNAVLTDAGPTVPYSGVSTGLVMHNLKRLQAGLRGEHIAADIEADNITNGVTVLPKASGKATSKGTSQADGDMDLEWQNMSEFERDERDVDESMGPEQTGSGIMDEREEERVLQFSNTAQSKQDKRHAKRARKHEQKRAREEQRATAAHDEEEEDDNVDDGDESSA